MEINIIFVNHTILISLSYTNDGVPRYKLVDGKAVERTVEEIEADRPKPPTPQPTVKDLQEQLLQTQLALTEVYEMILANKKISW